MHPIYLLLPLTTSLAAILNPLPTALPSALTPIPATITALPATLPPLPVDIPIPKTSVPYNPHILTAHLECGIFSTADGPDLDFMLAEILFRSSHNKMCVTPARTCRRHVCRATSAIYVCNDSDHELSLLCLDDVGLWAFRIAAECCPSGGKSGQIFNDERGYNVIAAYGNCNHGMDSDAPAMGPPDDPWGPNGEPGCN